ncbi:MAG: TonB-dependent receptor [Gammaproteobacteria bacterium]|nr:TonB-dependent receptor [Gammaproteobacteria bacterium]
MKFFDEFFQRTTVRTGSASKWALVFVVAFCLSNLSLAQDEDAETTDEDEEEEEDMPVVVATGSRVAETLGEIAGQIVILDEREIRAMGEQTLERVLRQLPQNLNPTTERFGSDLNNVTNFSASSTVNLRGLGSESTLILVDGKRVGHHGILGGVSDVSSIPLNQVERIEIVLDGASAIYGPDAVGGVVNIIMKKDYEGIEFTADYNSPTTEGYNESRFGVNFSDQIGAMNIRASFQKSTHTGLDASDREDITIFQQSLFPGPLLDVRFCCLADGTALPIAYLVDLGSWRGPEVVTVNRYNTLADNFKETAIAFTHALLPDDFSSTSSLGDIRIWRQPIWGAETQEGYTVLPDVNRESVTFGAYWELDDYWSVEGQIRQETRDVLNNRGYIAFNGETLAGNNPNNPFERAIHIRGQRRDYAQPYTETEATQLDFNLEVRGRVTDKITVEASIGQSSDDSTTWRHFEFDRAGLRAGMNSDGETPQTQFLFGETQESCLAKGGTFGFGLCRVSVPPPPAVDPWGDISGFISTKPLVATGLNRQFRVEGLIRSTLYELPGGAVRAVLGLSRQTLTLESSSEFQIGAVDASPIGDVTQFNTEAERTNSAIFVEGVVPLIGSDNQQPWADRLTMSISLRNDIYDDPNVTYVNTVEGNTSPTDIPDPGSESTWGMGMVWVPHDMFEVKYNFQTAFVAPQLNQLLRESARGPSPPFRGLFLQQPNGNLQQVGITIIEGGNPDLLSETADTQSLGITVTPDFVPNLTLNATFSDVEYHNRINRLANFIVDPNNLPSDVTYIPETDEYIQERRWINVSSVNRSGVDLTARWTTATDFGDFDIRARHSVINAYDYVIDPEDPMNNEVVSVVGEAEGTTAVGVVSKNSSNLNVSWFYMGIEFNFDLSTRSSTKTIFGGVSREYSPPDLVDLSMSYHIIPDGFLEMPRFLVGGRITVVINNAFDEYGVTDIRNDAGEKLLPTSPDSSPLYGRVVNVSLFFPVGRR